MVFSKYFLCSSRFLGVEFLIQKVVFFQVLLVQPPPIVKLGIHFHVISWWVAELIIGGARTRHLGPQRHGKHHRGARGGVRRAQGRKTDSWRVELRESLPKKKPGIFFGKPGVFFCKKRCNSPVNSTRGKCSYR